MKKEVIRYDVTARAAHTNFYFNNETNEFDREDCNYGQECYFWTTQEEMLSDFFKHFNPLEFKNSLDAYINLSKITEIWVREDVEDEWDFETAEKNTLIEFKVYDWLDNNGYNVSEV
jgi:hypothetical protein